MKSNIQRKTFIVLVAALGIFATGLSCLGGGSNEPQVTVRFWKPFDSADKWQDIISAYAQVRKNVRIEYTEKAPETYERDLLEAMAAGNGPDIFSIRNDWLPRYADKIRTPGAEALPARSFSESFVDVVSSDLIRDGQVYAVPSYVDVLALYYNRNHLASAGIARPPTTWDELLNQVPPLTKTTGSTLTRSAAAIGTSANINRAADILQLLMLQSGAQFYDPTFTTVALNQGQTDDDGDTPAARALKFYTQFADPSSRAYTWNSRQPLSIEAFTTGKVSMIFGYSYLIPTIAAKDAFLDYGIAGVPQVTNNKVNLASYWAETVWLGSRNSALAWDFIKFATNAEQNAKYVEKTKQPSSRRDVLQSQQQDRILGVFADNALSAKSVVKPDAVEFEKVMNDLINDVNVNGLGPVEAINRAAEKIRLLLQRYPIRPQASL